MLHLAKHVNITFSPENIWLRVPADLSAFLLTSSALALVYFYSVWFVCFYPDLPAGGLRVDHSNSIHSQ